MKKIIFLLVLFVFLIPASSDAQFRGKKTFFGPGKGKTILSDAERTVQAIQAHTPVLNAIKTEQINTTQKIDSLIAEVRKQNDENRKVTLKVLQELVKILGEQNETLKQLLEVSRKK